MFAIFSRMSRAVGLERERHVSIPPTQALFDSDARAALKHHFGFDAFRPLQEEIVADVLAGRDVFALLPTGGGKSLCFQLPAVMAPGLTVVVSPLIALMKDQVDAMTAAGVAATFLNSTLASDEARLRLRGLHEGAYRLLYVAPERLALGTMVADLRAWNVTRFAIDEAHCISEWGHDFRPEYRRLEVLRRRHPQTPVLAFTATATPRVRGDIMALLGLRDPVVHLTSFNRPNLFYRVRPKDSDTVNELLRQARGGGAGIVYCLSRRRVDELTAQLQAAGVRVRPYHAGLDPGTRRDNQEAFIRDDAQVIVATIAFGMGINKPDVRWVTHYDLPRSLESYYQESGRAGRDGDPARCTLFFGVGDIRTSEFLIQQKVDPLSGEALESEQLIARQRLRQVLDYAESTDCRRAIQLRYFDESFAAPCDACDNCCQPRPMHDYTLEARQFLSCIARLAQRGERFGAAYIIEILRGARTERILNRGHDRLSVYGIGRKHRVDEWRSLARSLLHQRRVEETQDGYAVLSLNEASWQVLRNETTFRFATAPQPRRSRSTDDAGPTVTNVRGDALFERLRDLRKHLADTQGLPPYVIFHDATLREMAARRPQTLSQFANIRGVGEGKLARYGEQFIAALRAPVD